MRHAQEKTDHNYQLLLALSQSNKSVIRSRNSKDVFSVVAGVLAKLGFHIGIFSLTNDREHLEITHFRLHSELLQAVQKLIGFSLQGYQTPIIQDGIFKRVIENGKAIYCGSFAEPLAEILPERVHPLIGQLITLMNIEGGIIVPQVIDGDVKNLFVICGTGLIENDIPAIETFAIQTTIALENTQLLKEMSESEKRYRNLYERVPIGLYRNTPDGKIEDANPALIKMLGFPNLEALQEIGAIGVYVDPHGRLLWQEIMDRDGLILNYEALFRRPDGENIWVQDNAAAIHDERGELIYYEGSLVDITDRKRAETASEQRANELQTLYQTSLEINSQRNLDDLLSAIVWRAAFLVGADAGGLYLMQPDDQALKLVVVHNLPKEYIGTILPLGEGLSGQTAQSGETMFVEDYYNWSARTDVYDAVEIGRTLSVPLKIEDKVIGVINISDLAGTGTFSEKEQRLVGLFAAQSAIAIENARLYTETNKRREYLTALRQIDTAITQHLGLEETLKIILNQVTDQLSVDAADVLLYNPTDNILKFAGSQGFRIDALKYTDLPMGHSYAGLVALKRRIIHIPDLNQQETGFLVSPLLKQEGFVTYCGIPLIANGELKGVLELFHRTPFNPTQEKWDFINTLAGQTANALDNSLLFLGLKGALSELTLAYEETLEGWVRALAIKNEETEEHSQRVTEITLRLVKIMGFDEDKVQHIRRGALLHDIGKIGVPENILLKPGPLTSEERKAVEKHPVYAYEWLNPIEYLRPALAIPYSHHEKWDGSGYPQGLKGEQIPLEARIFAVVDVWDALSSDRPYRKAWPQEKVSAHLREQSGKHFDPEIVTAFLKEINNR